MDCSLPGSSVHGIFQARILEWVAFPTPGDLPDPGIEPTFLVSLALAGGFFTTEPPGKPNLANKKKDDNNKNLNIERDVAWALEIHT